MTGSRALRERVRAANRADGRRIAVLDDDPTGSQTVHDVTAVLALDPQEYARGLAEPGSTCFVLTNTRSLPEPDAVDVCRRVGRALYALQRRLDAPVTVVSRSDSTLRGHLVAEVAALDEARRQVLGRGYDGVLLVPAYLEAGRSTRDDVHRARIDGRDVPVGQTEFARDPTFGYTASNLRDLLVERSGGRIHRDDVRSLGLDDIRDGGPDHLAHLLSGVRGGRFVVVNATRYADLETVALGLLLAQRAGRVFGVRCGPSFVRALAGLEPRPPLTGAQLWPHGRRTGHGLLVVGSHVRLTGRQVEVAADRAGLARVHLDVPGLLDPRRAPHHVGRAVDQVRAALADADVLLATSRTLVTGTDPEASLDVARTVSRGLVDVVRGALPARPGWMIAKGGITSHDVAVHGLGIRRATVLGQLLPGLVSVFRPLDAAPAAVGMPYVVFPGNVGDEHTLAEVVDTLRTGPPPERGPAGTGA